MREKLLTVPNIITAFRLIGSLVLLLFIPTYSTAFFIIYTLCGISDVVDGTMFAFQIAFVRYNNRSQDRLLLPE